MKTVDPDTVAAIVDRLRVGLEPLAIYLYGSHAYGTPHDDSDVDLLVVVAESDTPPHQRAAQAYRLLRGLKVPVELQVVTAAEFAQMAKWRASIERTVTEKGVTLYAAG